MIVQRIKASQSHRTSQSTILKLPSCDMKAIVGKVRRFVQALLMLQVSLWVFRMRIWSMIRKISILCFNRC